MNLGTIITGVVIAALCILPIILNFNKSQKHRKKMMQALDNLAKQQEGQINSYEIAADFAIGIDTTKNYLYFYRELEEKTITEVVDLWKISTAKISNITKITAAITVIERLELILNPKERKGKTIVLECYNADVNGQHRGELQSLERCHALVQSHLQFKAQELTEKMIA